MDDDQERRALRAPCKEFRKAMHQQIDAPVFDHDAKARLGHMIGRTALTGSNTRPIPPRSSYS
jgi:hypothetical protein